MRIKITGQKQLKVIGRDDLPKAFYGLETDIDDNNPFKINTFGYPIKLDPNAQAPGGYNYTNFNSLSTTGNPIKTPTAASIYGEPDPYMDQGMINNLAAGIKNKQDRRFITDKTKIGDTEVFDSKGKRVGEYKNESYTADPIKNKTRSYRDYNAAIPSMITSGMAMTNNLLQSTLNYNDEVDYAKKLGQTNASEPTVKNVYSRGRDVMNTPLGADYAPNMMTPVQFAGRPVSEFTGFPGYGRNIFSSKNGGLFKAADGTEFTESLGLPTLIENPDNYLRQDVPEIELPQVPAYQSPNVQPMEQTEDDAPDAEMSSEFAMPLKSIKITSGFGGRHAPVKGASSNHNGVDLAAPINTPVYAPMDGVVEKIYFNDKGGKQLLVRHNDGSRSGFAHLNDYNVSIGDKISRGQRIALSGNTGKSTGPHLHFTFRNSEGQFVDPSDFFNMGSKNKPEKGISNMDHNNPGNIHIGGFAQNYGAISGRKDAGGKVAIFPDMNTGMKAMEDLLFGNAYNNLTISQARNKWVNGSPNTSTSSTNSIVRSIGGDYRLSQLNPSQRKKLMSEFIKWEDRKIYDNLKTKGLIFKEGGEYELDDDEINYILANGGEVEYL